MRDRPASSAPDVLADVSRGWNCTPGGVAIGSQRSGVCAAVWSDGDDIRREVGGTLPDTHCVAIQLKRIRGNTFIDGRLRFTQPTARGAVNIVKAGETSRVIIDGPYSMLHLYLPADLLPSFLAEDGLAGADRLELVCPNLAHDDLISRIAGEILTEISQRSLLTRLRVDTLGQDLAIHLLRRWSNLADTPALKREPASGRLAAWQERRTVEFLQTHLAEDITLAQLASIARLSNFHFARAFKQSTGMPPHAYLRRLRCERAKDLLVSTSLSVSEIAAAVGYDTPQAFARMFRAEMGVSPSAFRRDRQS